MAPCFLNLCWKLSGKSSSWLFLYLTWLTPCDVSPQQPKISMWKLILLRLKVNERKEKPHAVNVFISYGYYGEQQWMSFLRYYTFCNACIFVCIDRQYIFHGLREGTLISGTEWLFRSCQRLLVIPNTKLHFTQSFNSYFSPASWSCFWGLSVTTNQKWSVSFILW